MPPETKRQLQTRVGLTAGLTLAALLLWSGFAKVSAPAEFHASVVNFRILDGVWARAAAAYLPWLELSLACGLLWSHTRKTAALLSLGLLLVFSAVLASAQVRGINPDCGCFGASSSGKGGNPLWPYLRNAGMAALCILAMKKGRS